MSFGSPKGAHCLNPIKYYDVFIDNTCYYQLSSTMTQFVGIYDLFKVTPIG